jgi:hypothetical protein
MRTSQGGECVRCGSTSSVHKHHVGGRNQIAWFVMPLCRECHEWFHAKFGQAMELGKPGNSKERLIRAMQAALVFLWMLLEMLKNDIRFVGVSRS